MHQVIVSYQSNFCRLRIYYSYLLNYYNPAGRMFTKHKLKSQLRFWYLLLPILIYFIVFSMYKIIETYIFRRPNLTCYNNNFIINFDHLMFQKILYNHIEYSQILGLLVVLAIPYLAHFVIPVIYLLYVFLAKKGWVAFWNYALAMGIAAFTAGMIQLAIPTKPPWIDLGLTGTGKFYKVDQALNIKIFKLIYGSNPEVCGAFPSLHTGWPTVLTFVNAIHPAIGAIYIFWLMSAAIYAAQHWVIDVIFGFLIGCGAAFLAKYIVRKLNVQNLMISLETESLQQTNPIKSDDLRQPLIIILPAQDNNDINDNNDKNQINKAMDEVSTKQKQKLERAEARE